MPAVEIGVGEVLAIITHIKKWIANLVRAKAKRKRESKEALKAVIMAIRETQIYLRVLKKRGKRGKSEETEKDLALKWTKLSLKVKELKLEKLTKRCEEIGKYWADPALLEKDFNEKIDNRLKELETSIKDIIDKI
jgi:hypothetical protein